MKHLVMLAMIAAIGVPTLAAAADTKPASVCRDDRKKFCKDAKTTGVKPRDCLMQHKDELSEACKAVIDRPKKAGKHEGEKAPTGETTAPTQPETKPTQSETPSTPSETPPPAQSETKPN
jgi:hypothetical protein